LGGTAQSSVEYNSAMVSANFPVGGILTPGSANEPLPGDFNHDGTVDGADYIMWRKNHGGIYTSGDYNTWRAHFGQTVGSGSGASANAAVPEPTTLVLLTFAAVGWCVRRRRTA
jgi:hypothetical protein